MTQDLIHQTEKLNQELLEEKYRVMGEIAQNVTKTKKRKAKTKDKPFFLSKYIKDIVAKNKRNKDKIKVLVWYQNHLC